MFALYIMFLQAALGGLININCGDDWTEVRLIYTSKKLQKEPGEYNSDEYGENEIDDREVEELRDVDVMAVYARRDSGRKTSEGRALWRQRPK